MNLPGFAGSGFGSLDAALALAPPFLKMFNAVICRGGWLWTPAVNANAWVDAKHSKMQKLGNRRLDTIVVFVVGVYRVRYR